MSLGKGLESLIPQKRGIDEQKQADLPASPRIQPAGQVFPPQPAIIDKEEDLIDYPEPSPAPVPQKNESVFQLEVEKIKSNPYQPRRYFDEDSLRELAQSIREFGIIQPLVVTKIEKEGDRGTEVEYQLVAGERRLKAAMIIGLTRVPAIIRKSALPKANLEVALIENIQRRDLNPIEEARAYARLQDEFNLTQREVAARVGKSRETVANTLRLLNLPADIQEAVGNGRLNESQARALLAITDPQRQAEVFSKFLEEKATVREVREKAKQEKSGSSRETYWENRLEEKFSAPAKIAKSAGRGRIILSFHSEEEWANLIRRLLGEED